MGEKRNNQFGGRGIIPGGGGSSMPGRASGGWFSMRRHVDLTRFGFYCSAWTWRDGTERYAGLGELCKNAAQRSELRRHLVGAWQETGIFFERGNVTPKWFRERSGEFSRTCDAKKRSLEKPQHKLVWRMSRGISGQILCASRAACFTKLLADVEVSIRVLGPFWCEDVCLPRSGWN